MNVDAKKKVNDERHVERLGGIPSTIKIFDERI